MRLHRVVTWLVCSRISCAVMLETAKKPTLTKNCRDLHHFRLYSAMLKNGRQVPFVGSEWTAPGIVVFMAECWTTRQLFCCNRTIGHAVGLRKNGHSPTSPVTELKGIHWTTTIQFAGFPERSFLNIIHVNHAALCAHATNKQNRNTCILLQKNNVELSAKYVTWPMGLCFELLYRYGFKLTYK